MTIHPTTPLADLATELPAASRVFHRLGLDYCCGGRRPLDEACREAGLDPGTVVAEIEGDDAGSESAESWSARPIGDLIAHILARYHETLRRELPELVALAKKVEDRHSGKPACPAGLAAHLEMIHGAVLDHLAKEEQVLFPLILAGRGPQAVGPVQVMEQEHRDHGQNLVRIRKLTGDLTAPEGACASWRALYTRLLAFEADLMEHVHLENNVLFPRALRD